MHKLKLLMFEDNLPRNMRHTLFTKLVQTAVKLDGLVFHELNGIIKSRYAYCEEVMPYFVKYIRSMVESGTKNYN